MLRSWLDLEFWRSGTWEIIKEKLNALEEGLYPPRRRIFHALRATPFRKVRAVILGQDPYHDGNATGLAFSANKATPDCPPSLKNIFKEYKSDLGFPTPSTGNLTPWARRGVLLLNTSLTVLPEKPTSHANIGWDLLLNEIMMEVSHTHPSCVFLLWGKHAENSATPWIGGSPRVVSPHPSGLSASKGFFGSRPFTKANALIRFHKGREIDWYLP